MLKISPKQKAQWVNVMAGMKDPRFDSGWSRPAKINLKNIFGRLDQQGKIGKLVLDAGSSYNSLAVDFGYTYSRYAVIGVDVGFEKDVEISGKMHRGDPSFLRVRGDLHDLEPTMQHPEIQDWLGKRRIFDPGFSTILLSDVLNYVDFRRVISSLRDDLLLPGGRIITCNMAGVVFKPEVDHPDGVKRNSELLSFMRVSGLQEEEVHNAKSGQDFTAHLSSIDRQILVFRKEI